MYDDFVNFEDTLVQSSGGSHMGRLHACIYEGECMYVFVSVFFEKKTLHIGNVMKRKKN